jgi:hypothetical protein
MSHSISRHLLPHALLGLCILMGFGAVSTRAQITQGGISISVTDQSGAAVANAVFAATGQRLRRLPLRLA